MSLKRLFKGKLVQPDETTHSHHRGHGHAGDDPNGHHDESNWLVSYADMMTLLCGFFIMLFSLASMEKPQAEKVRESLAKQFGADQTAPPQELAKFVTQILHETGIEGEASVKSDPAGVAVAFHSTVFFDTLSADVNPKGKVILEKLISGIAGHQAHELKQYKVVVEGHTDSRPILSGNYPSNWELSGARASRVVRLFMEKGFSPNLLTSIGYGDTRPELPSRLTDGSWDEVALNKNRRVVIRVLDPSVQAIPFPENDVKLTAVEAQPNRQPAHAEPATPEALQDAQRSAAEIIRRQLEATSSH